MESAGIHYRLIIRYETKIQHSPSFAYLDMQPDYTPHLNTHLCKKYVYEILQML